VLVADFELLQLAALVVDVTHDRGRAVLAAAGIGGPAGQQATATTAKGATIKRISILVVVPVRS
jgi:hypothetical protein